MRDAGPRPTGNSTHQPIKGTTTTAEPTWRRSERERGEREACPRYAPPRRAAPRMEAAGFAPGMRGAPAARRIGLDLQAAAGGAGARRVMSAATLRGGHQAYATAPSTFYAAFKGEVTHPNLRPRILNLLSPWEERNRTYRALAFACMARRGSSAATGVRGDGRGGGEMRWSSGSGGFGS
jgi:hypothetical protein